MKITPGRGEGIPSPLARGRLLIGGLRGSSGKTVITLGVIGAFKKRGLRVMPFKKGPDYIDAAWHTLAAGRPCYCLDTYLMGREAVVRQFARKSPGGIAVIEGNRGLFDGMDRKGSYSTAELAKLLAAPVVLVVDAAKMTRTTAALVLGCQRLDPAVNLRGVVLNLVAGARHEKVATEAIEDACGIPVLGAVPRLESGQAPERHLGLVTPQETMAPERWVHELAETIEPYLDVDRLLELAAATETFQPAETKAPARLARSARIGVIRDSAFPFYYAENLEALEEAGAELIWIRALDDLELPEVDALYLGGGFPETHAGLLAGNERFRRSLRRMAASGLPIYAECGGAIYLGRKLYYQGRSYEMAGLVPVDFEFCARPQGHGYTSWRVDKENPFYPVGAVIRGHEFHYTRAREFDAGRVETVAAVERGAGFDGRREGVRVGNVAAFYGHVHALGCPEWTAGMLKAAARYAETREASEKRQREHDRIDAPALKTYFS